MNIWAIQSRKQRQKNIDTENLLAAKVDKTEYNKFIENKKKMEENKRLRSKATYAKTKQLKQNNIIMIDDNKNNNNNEINNNEIVKTPTKKPKIVKNKFITPKNIKIITPTKQKIVKNKIITPNKKEIFYKSALTSEILILQTNEKQKSNCIFTEAINRNNTFLSENNNSNNYNNENFQNYANNNIFNYDILNDINNYENIGNMKTNNFSGKVIFNIY